MRSKALEFRAFSSAISGDRLALAIEHLKCLKAKRLKVDGEHHLCYAANGIICRRYCGDVSDRLEQLVGVIQLY